MSSNIYKVTEYDLQSIPINKGNMYVCSDSYKMYEDVSNAPNGREIFNATLIDTELYRQYSVKPENGTYYYVWETNVLYLYNNGWSVIRGRTISDPIAYYIDSSGISDIDKNQCCVDDNGLLKDGSVVVRDPNKIIKGKLYIDQTTNNLVISSFLGGGIQFLPLGNIDERGSLFINPTDIEEKDGKTIYTPNPGLMRFVGSIHTIDNDMYVDKKLDDDTTRSYKVYTEEDFAVGEWELTSQDIIDKLNSNVIQPLPINVEKLNGINSDGYAKFVHKHKASDITDLSDTTVEFLSNAFNGDNKGISIEYNENRNTFDFSANDFILRLKGGVKGEGTIQNLTETEINVTVDPDRHTHVLDKISGWKEFHDSYRSDIDNLTANKLDKSSIIYKSRRPDVNEILVLAMNSEGLLDSDILGNSATTTKLKQAVTIALSSGVSGSAVFDGSKNINIVATVDPNKHSHSQYILEETKGNANGVASLDDSGKIPTIQLPDSVLGNLQFQGTFDPSTGVPSNSPTKGQYWVAQGQGTIDGQEYLTGDWIIYDGSSWQYLDNSGAVQSIQLPSGEIRSGVVSLTAEDIEAVPMSYIYDSEKTLETGLIVLTDSDGEGNIIIPVKSLGSKLADKLASTFRISSDPNSEFSAISNRTDGSEDLSLLIDYNYSNNPVIGYESMTIEDLHNGYSYSTDSEKYAHIKVGFIDDSDNRQNALVSPVVDSDALRGSISTIALNITDKIDYNSIFKTGYYNIISESNNNEPPANVNVYENGIKLKVVSFGDIIIQETSYTGATSENPFSVGNTEVHENYRRIGHVQGKIISQDSITWDGWQKITYNASINPATSTTIGGIKVGSGLSVTSEGVLSVSGIDDGEIE